VSQVEMHILVTQRHPRCVNYTMLTHTVLNRSDVNWASV